MTKSRALHALLINMLTSLLILAKTAPEPSVDNKIRALHALLVCILTART